MPILMQFTQKRRLVYGNNTIFWQNNWFPIKVLTKTLYKNHKRKFWLDFLFGS